MHIYAKSEGRVKSLKTTQTVLAKILTFLGVLGHQIHKFYENLVNLGVLIRKGGTCLESFKIMTTLLQRCRNINVILTIIIGA